ncbi:hypothetical protein JF544_02470 [Halobacillus kuroshimensis]|uniref:Uncharacterized protein n=1 Tax=Halobacillus kuroshimensis TaxID=302481 RepID=A0ABS3DRX2_9BACI|nr:hypothetical protein [Halobacillus kuroshimensis]MBN8234088.1 hypothetical protein [Halobacillus kuroshimensis]
MIPALLIIIISVVVDYFWLDVDRKKWGWMKSWTRSKKALFISGFLLVTILIYTGMG